MSGAPVPAPRARPHHGLPERLPEGERLLWQGAPDWRAMARNVFHVRALAAYFALIVAWTAVSGGTGGETAAAVALSTARVLAVACVPLGVVALYSWLVGRSTTYSITTARVVVRLGLALPITINLPFHKIDRAALRVARDGSGDISLLLMPGDRLAYFVLWPHARPWRMGRVEPTLRSIPDAARVGQLLARALAASADMPAPAMADQLAAAHGTHQAVPA